MNYQNHIKLSGKHLFLRMFLFVMLLFSFDTSYSQSDWEVTKAIRQLETAKGRVGVESIFPVDTAELNKWHKAVYFDAEFNRRPKLDDKSNYRLNQLMYQENLPMYSFFKNPPDSMHLDSLVISKERGTNKNTFLVHRGTLIYKEGKKTFCYEISNGYVQEMTITKKDKLWSTGDFSGLYENDKWTWPVMKDFDNDGELELTTTIMYLSSGMREVRWEQQK